MLLAVSRFRVANGMEADVRTAFLRRPRLVDAEPGFLGIEVFEDTIDRTIFYLITRWTDVESFRQWHRSDAHRMSHSGIPKGLRLDPAFTKVRELDRLQPEPIASALELIAADHAPLFASFLATSHHVYLLLMTRAGIIVSCNDGLERRLASTPGQLIGCDVRRLLSIQHADLLAQRLARDERSPSEPLTLDFVANGARKSFTLRCLLDVQPDAAIIIAEGAEAPA